jgi:hypothetical protein
MISMILAEVKYFWWFERVVCWKVDGEEENTTGIWTIALEIC